MRRFVNTAFIVVFFVTLLWSPVMMLINGVMPVFLLLAELDFYFCLRYFLNYGAPKGKFRSITNGVSIAVSSLVLLLYITELIICSGLGVQCIYTVLVGKLLVGWTLAYVLFRCVYLWTVDAIDKKQRENIPMWLLDEDVFLLGKVRGGKFYPDSDKCGFYSQTIDSTMYGRTLFGSLEEAISICGDLPVIDAETYKEE